MWSDFSLFVINLLSLIGIGVTSYFIRLFRQRYPRISITNTTPSSFDSVSQCEKGVVESVPLLPVIEKDTAALRDDHTTTAQLDDAEEYESDRLEMVGVHPHDVESHFSSPSPSDEDEDEDGEYSIEPHVPSSSLLPCMVSEGVLPKKTAKEKRAKAAALGIDLDMEDEDDDEEQDAHMGGTMVDFGSMQVKGMRDVIGEWGEEEERVL